MRASVTGADNRTPRELVLEYALVVVEDVYAQTQIQHDVAEFNLVLHIATVIDRLIRRDVVVSVGLAFVGGQELFEILLIDLRSAPHVVSVITDIIVQNERRDIFVPAIALRIQIRGVGSNLLGISVCDEARKTRSIDTPVPVRSLLIFRAELVLVDAQLRRGRSLQPKIGIAGFVVPVATASDEANQTGRRFIGNRKAIRVPVDNRRHLNGDLRVVRGIIGSAMVIRPRLADHRNVLVAAEGGMHRILDISVAKQIRPSGAKARIRVFPCEVRSVYLQLVECGVRQILRPRCV